MSKFQLNLDDIQGNVTRAYGRFSFSHARYFFLHIEDSKAGRSFVDKVRRHVTTAHRWDKENKPLTTLNIAFTWMGLVNLGLPTRTLSQMPDEFIDGMKLRAHILGDRPIDQVKSETGDWCKHWDPIWQNNRKSQNGGADDVHIWISINAQGIEGSDQPIPELESQTQMLRDLCAETGGKVRILATNGANGDQEYQEASAIFQKMPDGTPVASPKEHFGFTDGIGDPVFEGQYSDAVERDRVIGRGKWMNEEQKWQPLATGEFILGHVDESQELPPTAAPANFMKNGSFMAYRKLHQNVTSFEDVIEEEAQRYASVMDVEIEEARETLKAKMVGRWSDGVPLATVPTYKAWQQFRKDKGFENPDPATAALAMAQFLRSSEASDFKYGDDMQGLKCPVGAHLRRSNTRDHLDPSNSLTGENPKATTQLNKRRRILRRGLPYGAKYLGEGSDDTEQGIAMMIVCANLFRQFEFVQQQWIQYGLDFNEGNNTCPILGRHDKFKRHPIPSDPASGKPPYVMSKLKNFVETRGGDYFFIPSVTALRMIAMGIIDPT